MHTERAQLKLDATAVYTALGVNERLFICTSSQVEQLVSNGERSVLFLFFVFLIRLRRKCHHFRHIFIVIIYYVAYS